VRWPAAGSEGVWRFSKRGDEGGVFKGEGNNPRRRPTRDSEEGLVRIPSFQHFHN